MDRYDLIMADEKIGCVTVRKDGLYLQISCRCDLSGEVMFQLNLDSNKGRACLGTLVPMDGRFGLETSVAGKRVGEGDLKFSLQPKHEVMDKHFIPIHPEEPFSYLSRLEQAYLCCRHGQIGLVLSNEK